MHIWHKKYKKEEKTESHCKSINSDFYWTTPWTCSRKILCGQFSWRSALNMEGAITFPDISSFGYLHISVVFPEALLSGVGSYLKYSWGVFAPREPWSVDQSAFSPQTSHSQLSSVSEWSRRLPSSDLVHVSNFGWHICGSLFILKQGPWPSSVLGSITFIITN